VLFDGVALADVQLDDVAGVVRLVLWDNVHGFACLGRTLCSPSWYGCG